MNEPVDPITAFERALDILGPHLRDQSLYEPKERQ